MEKCANNTAVQPGRSFNIQGEDERFETENNATDLQTPPIPSFFEACSNWVSNKVSEAGDELRTRLKLLGADLLMSSDAELNNIERSYYHSDLCAGRNPFAPEDFPGQRQRRYISDLLIPSLKAGAGLLLIDIVNNLQLMSAMSAEQSNHSLEIFPSETEEQFSDNKPSNS